MRRQCSDKRRWPAQPTAGWEWTGPTGRRLRTFTARRAVSSGELRSPGDASREGACGSRRQSALCADDREGPAVPRAAGVAATPWFERAKLSRHHERREAPFERPRNRVPALPATRAAEPREKTAGRRPRIVVRKTAPRAVLDRKSTRLNSSHSGESRMPSSA